MTYIVPVPDDLIPVVQWLVADLVDRPVDVDRQAEGSLLVRLGSRDEQQDILAWLRQFGLWPVDGANVTDLPLRSTIPPAETDLPVTVPTGADLNIDHTCLLVCGVDQERLRAQLRQELEPLLSSTQLLEGRIYAAATAAVELFISVRASAPGGTRWPPAADAAADRAARQAALTQATPRPILPPASGGRPSLGFEHRARSDTMAVRTLAGLVAALSAAEPQLQKQRTSITAEAVDAFCAVYDSLRRSGTSHARATGQAKASVLLGVRIATRTIVETAIAVHVRGEPVGEPTVRGTLWARAARQFIQPARPATAAAAAERRLRAPLQALPELAARLADGAEPATPATAPAAHPIQPPDRGRGR